MAYIRHVTLVANTAQTFTLTDNSSSFEVLNRNGLGEIYISYDGTANPAVPTVGGNDLDVIVAASGAALQSRRIGSLPITIKVISPAATAISFRGIA